MCFTFTQLQQFLQKQHVQFQLRHQEVTYAYLKELLASERGPEKRKLCKEVGHRLGCMHLGLVLAVQLSTWKAVLAQQGCYDGKG